MTYDQWITMGSPAGVEHDGPGPTEKGVGNAAPGTTTMTYAEWVVAGRPAGVAHTETTTDTINNKQFEAEATAQRLAEAQAAAAAKTASEVEAKRVAAAAEQQKIIAGITPAAEAMRTDILGQTEADKARIEALVSEYTKPVDVTARTTAEQAKVDLETAGALTEAEKKIKSEAAVRGGLYGGGYMGAMGEAEVAGALSKVQRMATFEDTLAKEQEERGKLGLAYTMDLYKTHTQNVYQSYQTAYNIVTEKAKMAQQAGQFDTQLAWEQEALKIDQTFKANMQAEQITAQKEMAKAEAELKLLLADKEAAERELDRAFTAGENQKARDLQLKIAEMNKEIAEKQAEATKTAGLWQGIGSVIGGIVGAL